MSEDGFEWILKQEFRWPQQGDRLFTTSTNAMENAAIDSDGHTRLVLMTDGYKKGADLMVKQSAAGHYERGTLVFPIVFNYRQFIELSLKYLIATYGPEVGVPANWNTHRLEVLWKDLQKILSGYGSDDPDKVDPVVETLIAEFAKVDPRSFSYRYPVDTNGNLIPLLQSELDLAALADTMNALDGYFTGCDGYLDSLKNAAG